jgi:DNA-binding transcriptional ArsR family regulator
VKVSSRRTAAAVLRQPVRRDPAAILSFIERFAALLAEAGFARMPARVFVALLATDSGTLTAAELGDLLRVSPAAVSGAVRYLTQLNLVSREREPGSRRDRYRVHDDVWYSAVLRRDQMLLRWERSVRDGVALLGRDTPAGARLAETLDYFEFVQAEVPALLARWERRRAGLHQRG